MSCHWRALNLACIYSYFANYKLSYHFIIAITGLTVFFLHHVAQCCFYVIRNTASVKHLFPRHRSKKQHTQPNFRLQWPLNSYLHIEQIVSESHTEPQLRFHRDLFRKALKYHLKQSPLNGTKSLRLWVNSCSHSNRWEQNRLYGATSIYCWKTGWFHPWSAKHTKANTSVQLPNMLVFTPNTSEP